MARRAPRPASARAKPRIGAPRRLLRAQPAVAVQPVVARAAGRGAIGRALCDRVAMAR
jgi:hypothetical protein